MPREDRSGFFARRVCHELQLQQFHADNHLRLNLIASPVLSAIPTTGGLFSRLRDASLWLFSCFNEQCEA